MTRSAAQELSIGRDLNMEYERWMAAHEQCWVVRFSLMSVFASALAFVNPWLLASSLWFILMARESRKARNRALDRVGALELQTHQRQ